MQKTGLEFYKELLGITPPFLEKYIYSPGLWRLKRVGYFCGMDYASKDLYQFKEYISRYDHSLTTALWTWKYTQSPEMTLAALFHDIATPCFSHVIDYMNKDYMTQESTEVFTQNVIMSSRYIQSCLKEDGIKRENVTCFKDYSIVDNQRPKLCADRLDGTILTAYGWTKEMSLEEIEAIVKNIEVYQNENQEAELGFQDETLARSFVEHARHINKLCHSNEDNYMMELLASITRQGIQERLFTYRELYLFSEEDLLALLETSKKERLRQDLEKFYKIKKEEIEEIQLPPIKERKVNPLVRGRRLMTKED